MNGKETKHVVGFRKNKAQPDEDVFLWLDGYVGKMMGTGDDAQRDGVLILTSQRVVFYRKGFLGEVYENIPTAKVTSVEVKSVLGHRTLRIHTSHDDLTFKTLESRDLVDEFQSRLEAQRDAPVVAATPAAVGDPIEQIRKLSDLRDAGVLDEEEFQAKKAQLLARL